MASCGCSGLREQLPRNVPENSWSPKIKQAKQEGKLGRPKIIAERIPLSDDKHRFVRYSSKKRAANPRQIFF